MAPYRNNILVADGGSTKVKWALITPEDAHAIYTTLGFNPLLPPQEGMEAYFTDALNAVAGGVDEVWYYGAGCIDSVCPEVAKAIASAVGCPTANVNVGSDMLGAARALLGHHQGVACILGTGSNSCLFDGAEIVEHTPALGYVLGDEGSGAVLGRKLLGDIFKGQASAEVVARFNNRYGLSMGDVIERVYRCPAPNRFLASFAPFIRENLHDEGIRSMVAHSFREFLERNVMAYADVRTLPLRFTGSIAVHFDELLLQEALHLGLNDVAVTADPIEGLADYHAH